jgi:hypothetical protein
VRPVPRSALSPLPLPPSRPAAPAATLFTREHVGASETERSAASSVLLPRE